MHIHTNIVSHIVTHSLCNRTSEIVIMNHSDDLPAS